MSTLIPQKDPMRLIEVADKLWRRRKDFCVLIVGGGPFQAEMEIACRQRGLDDCVIFLGWVKDAAESILPRFDIFLQTSRWEAMSVVILEAMAAGVPIVATRVGENQDVLRDQESGMLVDIGDTDGMMSAVERLLDDKGFRKRLSSEARESYRERFTGRVMAENYAGLYRSLV
jgi:glycosyltransferase involved in cell wall biosynthesis